MEESSGKRACYETTTDDEPNEWKTDAFSAT
jgi:hypothetical protein